MTNSQATAHESWLVICLLHTPGLAEAISITRSKISCSLIEPQILLCTPAYGNEFHALVVHPQPTFTAPPVISAYGTGWRSVVELFLRKQSTC